MNLFNRKNLFEPQLPLAWEAGLKVVGHERQSTWQINVPASKSITNRAIVLAALAGHSLEMVAPLLADDTWWGFLALEKLGFRLDVSQLPQRLVIEPPRDIGDTNSKSLFLGQAGTLARFMPSVLLNWNVLFPQSSIQEFILDCDPQLQRRPLTPLVQALRSLGGRVEGDALPFLIRPSELHGQCEIDGSVSGQFLSGLLFATAGARREFEILRVNQLVQPDYVRITMSMLEAFGAEIDADRELQSFVIKPRKLKGPKSYVVEADASTACYFAALACVLGIDLKIENLGSSTLQPDFQFMAILQRFGFAVEWDSTTCSVFGQKKHSFSGSDQIIELDLSACSDQAISAGVMSLCTGIGVRVTGVAHIRHHESDRITSFCSNCRNLGVEVKEYSDGFMVPRLVDVEHLCGEWRTHGDHRFALAGIILAAKCPGISVLNVDCIKKTAPGFIQQLKNLGIVFSS